MYGKTQREVLDKMRACRDQVASGIAPSQGRLTVAQYGELWLDGTKRAEVTRGHNSESTLRNYRDLWERHIAPDLGHLRLDKLTPAVLREWLARKATQASVHGGPLSSSTQARIHAVLRAALNDAVRDDLLKSNPLDRVRPPRAGAAKITPLTAEQVAALRPRADARRRSEGFAAVAAMREAGVPRRRRILLTAAFAVPILIGAALGYLALRQAPDVIALSVLALTGRALSAVVVEEMVSEAHATRRARSAGTLGLACGSRGCCSGCATTSRPP